MKSVITTTIAALALSLSIWTPNAMAQEEALKETSEVKCSVQLEQAAEMMADPNYSKLVDVFTKEQQKKFAAAHVELYGAVDEIFETGIWIGFQKVSGGYVIHTLTPDCVWYTGQIPQDAYEKIMKAAFGEGA